MTNPDDFPVPSGVSDAVIADENVADPPPLPDATSTIITGQKETNQQISEAIGQVFSTMTMEMKSILNGEQIFHLARLLIFAEKHQSSMAAKIALVLMELKVSEKGYGRRDMREVLMALLQKDSPEVMQQKSLFQRLVGRG